MSEKKISISWKPGTGFESPLINVQGDSAAEVDHNLRELIQSGLLTRVLQSAVNSQQEYTSLKRGASGYVEEPPQEVYSQPPVGAQPTQNPWDAQQAAQQGQQPPWDNWSSGGQQTQQAPPQQHQGAQQGWGQQNPAPQPQQGGAPVCKCGKVMEHKVTGGGKPVWRCTDWRWNNGNPTPNHDQIWVEGN